MIISSHLLAMIEDVCTHLLVMQKGRVRYHGATAELRTRFPHANSLEEAYFAATHAATADADNLNVINAARITIPIESFQSGVSR